MSVCRDQTWRVTMRRLTGAPVLSAVIVHAQVEL